MTDTNPLYTPPQATTVSLPKDRRIILLFILGGVFILLLLLNLIVSLIRATQPKSANRPPALSPTPSSLVTPTLTSTNIPTQYQDQVNSINQKLNQQLDFPPPQIDTDIGL